MVNNCFYTKFRAKIVKIFDIYKKNRLLSDFLFYFHIIPPPNTSRACPPLDHIEYLAEHGRVSSKRVLAYRRKNT